MRILILSDSATTTGVKSLKAEASKRGYKVTVLSPSEISLYVSNAAKAVGLSVAGVDLIRDAKGKVYVVEVNSNPGFQIENITGVSISKHILDFADKEMVEFRKRRQVIKDRASDLESIINSLIEDNRKLWYYLQPLTESKFLKELRKKLSGKHLKYFDREGQLRKKLIRTNRDLLMVITETFNISKQ